jgi:hypothetical protein
MSILKTPDPNKDRNDPMVPEHWELGESIQDRIRNAGFARDEVEGIAVDIHDLLQAADAIRDSLGPAILRASRDELAPAVRALAAELNHVRWHCESAEVFLTDAGNVFSAPVQ